LTAAQLDKLRDVIRQMRTPAQRRVTEDRLGQHHPAWPGFDFSTEAL
jgi:hypothetical protein